MDQSTATTNDAPTLGYGRETGLHKKWVLRAIVMSLLLGLGVAGWHWGPGIWRQGRLLYWQHKCLELQSIPNFIAYEEEPKNAAALIGSDHRYVRSTPATQAAAYTPACWRNYVGLVSLPFFRPPAPTAAVMFCDELISRSGNRRLVVLCYQPRSGIFSANFIEDFNYQSFVITPATWRNPPVIPQKGLALSVLGWTTTPAPNVRIYSGQVDPRDPSHFTIVYEMWSKRDTLDGYLDDYDYVTLKARKTPMPLPDRRLQ